MGEVIQFIPRPNHNRDTDFPAIPFKSSTAEYIMGLDKNLKAQATEIMNVVIVDDHCENAIWGPNGILPPERSMTVQEYGEKLASDLDKEPA